MLLAGAVLLACLLAANPARAQIEMDTDGNVGVGSVPDSHYKLQARYETGGPSRGTGIRGASSTSGGSSTGVSSYANGSTVRNIGVAGFAKDSPDPGVNANTYGVYGTIAYGSTGDYAGYFDGNVHVTGSLTQASDRRFKEAIESLGASGSSPDGEPQASDVTARLLQLRPVSFQFSSDGPYAYFGFPSGRQYGLIAQEVEQVFPELVSEETHPGRQEVNEEGEVVSWGDPVTYEGVNYSQLVPVLVQAVQDQQAEVEALESEALESEVETLKAALESQGISTE